MDIRYSDDFLFFSLAIGKSLYFHIVLTRVLPCETIHSQSSRAALWAETERGTAQEVIIQALPAHVNNYRTLHPLTNQLSKCIDQVAERRQPNNPARDWPKLSQQFAQFEASPYKSTARTTLVYNLALFNMFTGPRSKYVYSLAQSKCLLCNSWMHFFPELPWRSCWFSDKNNQSFERRGGRERDWPPWPC